MFDGLGHGGMLPIGNAIFLGGLLHDAGQWGVVSVANKRAEMVDDVMVQAADEPADQRGLSRVVGRGGEDMVDPVIEFVAVGGEVGAVDHVRRLEDERNAQADDQMRKHESQGDEQRGFSQQHDRQNEHVNDVKSFSGKKSDV